MIVIRKELCPQNHPCPALMVCPEGAISQVGYAAPTVDDSKCLACGKCSRRCRVFSQVNSGQGGDLQMA